MIQRIRDRRDFDRLAREGVRIRCSALWCTWCPDPESTATKVAYVFGRAYGPAVARNRIRRRIRAVLVELDRREPLPAGMLIIGGQPELREHTFDQLTESVTTMVHRVRRHGSSG